MRVAFFSDMLVKDHDGCMRTMFHILDRKPDEVDIKFFTGSDSSLHSISVPDVTLPFNKDYKMALPFLKQSELKNALADFNPDLIHIATPSALGSFAANYGHKHGIKVSTIYHTHYLSYISAYLKSVPALIPLMRMAMASRLRKFYNTCDLILVPTPIIRDELEEIGILSHKMALWARGLDKNTFNPDAGDKNWLADQMGNENPTVLFASRLVWEKNLETLIRIYGELKQSSVDLNFVIAGDGSARKELEAVMPRAHFLGAVDQKELARYYASADVFVFPSVSETYGNVVVEAMACGTPCVIGNGGGTTTFIDQGVNGWKVPAYEEGAYVDKVEQLLNDEQLYGAMREAGLAATVGMDWDALVEGFYDRIKELTGYGKRVAA